MALRSTEVAAGGIVWRNAGSSIEILVAHRPKYDDWAFPKGRLDRGETILECAHREVVEETGLSIDVERRLPDLTYRKPSGRRKLVAYWAMKHRGGKFIPNREVDLIMWLEPRKAMKQLTYLRDRDLLDQLPDKWNRPAKRLIVVRHAEAGRRSDWKKDDRKRPLSKAGRRQASRLVTKLAGYRIDRIISSPAARCIETVAPLAEDRSLDVSRDNDLWETAGKKATVRMLENLSKGTTVLSTHRPIVERIVQHLDLPARTRPTAKGALWLVEFRKGQVTDAHHFRASR